VTLARLAWRNAVRRPVRAALLVAFSAISVLAFTFLRSIVATLDEAVRSAATDRIAMSSAVSLFSNLPASYLEPVRSTEGVRRVVRFSWFGGYHQDPSARFYVAAIDPEPFFAAYPEIRVPEEQRRAFLSDRMGCLIGTDLAKRRGFRVGDVVPILGGAYALPDGRPWEFVVRGIYESDNIAMPAQSIYFQWEYLEETRRSVPSLREGAGTVTIFMVQVAPGHAIADVAARLDARWASGPVRTRTQTEQAFRAERISAFGNLPFLLGAIGGVALLAMFLSVANAMAMVAAERARETGVVKALGFSDRVAAGLVVAESCALVGVGGLLGAGAAFLASGAIRRAIAGALPNFFVSPATTALAIGLAIAIGVSGALLPALRLRRIRTVDVLRADG
jgi:putative ABC transport system permease protein